MTIMLPPMPDPGAVPDAAVSDATLLDLADQIGQEQVGIMAQTAPEPNKPYKQKTMEYLLSSINAFAEKFPDIPPVVWEFTAREGPGGDGWIEPLPQELFVPLLAISDAVKVVNTDGAFDEYIMDPMDIPDDLALRVIADTVNAAVSDDALMEVLAAGPAPEGAPVIDEAAAEGAEMEVADDLDKYTRI